MDVLTDVQSGFVNIPLLLPVVPAGFTGMLQIGLMIPDGAQDSVVLAAIGDPVFNPGLDPGVVSGALAGAQAYLQTSGVSLSPALVLDLEQYTTNQFRLVVENGRAAFVASLGTEVQVYSASQLHFDRVFFGAARAAGVPLSATKPKGWFSAIFRLLISLLSRLGPTEAQAQQQNCPVYKKGDILQPGCTTGGLPDEPFLPPAIPPPPGCNLKDPSTFKKCKLTVDHCDALPGYKVVRNSNGEPFCVPEKPSKNCSRLAANPVGGNYGCLTFPLRPTDSTDPNDKVGTLGATPSQFLLSGVPFTYTVFFENLATATAAAQEVVITDQLDVGKMDLDTFSLGPISFGDITMTPASGVQQFTVGVDLRPEQNLIVTIHSTLEKSTGLLTWRFTSIDPDTGQLTEDPNAGFLPPNVNPPKGEGSVVFTVLPQPGMATGTTICNKASIVFDVNAPIETPQWCNTIDYTPPTSQVLPLAVTQTSLSFPVQWAGTDPGSGIQDFTIFVADNGGPFNPFISDTTNTSATFTGQNGHTYAFYSIATDLADNIENSKAVADTVTTVTLSQLPTAGDLNSDGKVDCADLAIVKASFGKRCGQAGFDSRADTNKDCVVDVRDLAFVSQKLPVSTRCP